MKFLAGFVWIDPTHYQPLARTAEECGWDGIVLSDHLVHLEKIATPYPYAEGGERPWQAADPYPDVWVSTGAMAAVTQRIQFYQGVYVVPMRDRNRLCYGADEALLSLLAPDDNGPKGHRRPPLAIHQRWTGGWARRDQK